MRLRSVVAVSLFGFLLVSSVPAFGDSCHTTHGKSPAAGTYNKDARWAASATFTDSCCCHPSCPCFFGSPASRGHCDGVTLLEFQRARAHYGEVNLDGVAVVAVFRSNRSMNYYVSDQASKAQTEAVVKLIPQYIQLFDLDKVTTVKNVPIQVDRQPEQIKVTTPEASFEIVVMKGQDGKPIKLQNLPAQGFPAPAFLDHTQFKSTSLVHRGQDEEFEYEGTNGLVTQLATVSSAD